MSKELMTNMETISQKDRAILRRLAQHKLELHHSEQNQRNLKDWLLHNTFRGQRPMIHLEMGTFWQDVIPKRLQCEGELARDIEGRLWAGFINLELFGDDYPIRDIFHVDNWHQHTPFGIDIKTVHATDDAGNDTLAYKFLHPINDLEEDFHKLGSSIYALNQWADGYAAAARDVFGDILPVEVGIGGLYCCPTQFIVHMMGMETMMISMYDYPELFHEMMRRYAEDTLTYFRFLEQNNALSPTTGAQTLGQGTWCFTDELPATGVTKTTQVWGFMDSQETVGLSPTMFEEFIFPYYEMIAKQCGLLSYGCCEPVHMIWENCLSKWENLRKISISPWCDEEYMGAALRGRKVIFHRKPSPNYLGMGTTLDEEAVRAHIRKTLKAAQGCTVEFTQRDVYTINNDEAKAKRYIDLIREEIVNCW